MEKSKRAKATETFDETNAITAGDDIMGDRKACVMEIVQGLLPPSNEGCGEKLEEMGEVAQGKDTNKKGTTKSGRKGKSIDRDPVQQAAKLKELIVVNRQVVDADLTKESNHGDNVIALDDDGDDTADNRPVYSFPKILTAAERKENITAATDTYLKDIIGVDDVSREDEKGINPQIDMIKIKTRMDKHEKKWKIEKDGAFGKLKGHIGEMYGISAQHVILKFDDDKIEDTDTPRSLDLDDDDLLDVKLDKASGMSSEKAIVHATAAAKAASAPAPATASTPNPALSGSADEKIVIKIVHCLPDSGKGKESDVTVFANRDCGTFLKKVSERIIKDDHAKFKYVVAHTGAELIDNKSFVDQGIVPYQNKINVILK